MEKKKTAVDILIEAFLKDVDERGTMPWQRPYERYNAFNWYTKKVYRGFNRLLLPFGEYLTKNQITKYNVEKGYIKLDENGRLKDITPQAYYMQKGIKWLPVVFFKVDKKSSSREEIAENFPDFDKFNSDEIAYAGRKNGYLYYVEKGKCIKSRNILRYYDVADRKHFRNANGDYLPSRIETGEVEITKSDAKEVMDNYINLSGVKVDYKNYGTPCYVPDWDLVRLNPLTKSEDAWFSTAFHELAHSTGAASRLNRKGVVSPSVMRESTYAVEECIAEIAACLCCAETGISDFETSCSEEYDNSVSYVQAWKKRVKDWGKDFIYIVSQADKAFNMICGAPDSVALDEDGQEIE